MRRPNPILLLCLAALLAGCRAVKFSDQGRFSQPAMAFGSDGLHDELRGHVLTPREASIGGFTSVGAGGCGCH